LKIQKMFSPQTQPPVGAQCTVFRPLDPLLFSVKSHSGDNRYFPQCSLTIALSYIVTRNIKSLGLEEPK